MSDTMDVRRELPSRQVGDELVVRDPDSGRVVFLNETAADVWQLARTGPSVEMIVAAICAKYAGAAEAQVRADVKHCLDELADLGFIDIGSSDGGRSLKYAK